jgi:hypothetical protein
MLAVFVELITACRIVTMVAVVFLHDNWWDWMPIHAVGDGICPRRRIDYARSWVDDHWRRVDDDRRRYNIHGCRNTDPNRQIDPSGISYRWHHPRSQADAQGRQNPHCPYESSAALHTPILLDLRCVADCCLGVVSKIHASDIFSRLLGQNGCRFQCPEKFRVLHPTSYPAMLV